MKKFIATTSINPNPKDTSYESFIRNHPDWTLVIAGDINSQNNVYKEFVEGTNAVYLSWEDQRSLYPQLHALIGERTDLRKMLAIYYSYKEGADVVALIDDDNFPTPDWGSNLLLDTEITCKQYENFMHNVVDPLSVVKFSDKVWHRGYPVDKLSCRDNLWERVTIRPIVQADFWLGDPDTDALCRLMGSTRDFLNEDASFESFTVKKYAPFNCQNVFLSRSVVPYYFLFPSLGRMSDIWIAYYIESIFKDPIVVYNMPSVEHIRNDHDVLTDFRREFEGYMHTSELINDLEKNTDNFSKYVTPEEWVFYKEYTQCLLTF